MFKMEEKEALERVEEMTRKCKAQFKEIEEEEKKALEKIRELTNKIGKVIPLSEVLEAGINKYMIMHLLKRGDIFEPRKNLIQLLE